MRAMLSSGTSVCTVPTTSDRGDPGPTSTTTFNATTSSTRPGTATTGGMPMDGGAKPIKGPAPIPRFYFGKKPPAKSDSEGTSLERNVRELMDFHMRNLASEFVANWCALSPSDVDSMMDLLMKRSDTYEGESCLDYDTFKQVGAELGHRYQPYFTASVFASLPHDHYARISLKQFHEFVTESEKAVSILSELIRFDSTGSGFLQEQDLQRCIQSLLPSISGLSNILTMEREEYSMYAARHFFFLEKTFGDGKLPLVQAASCDSMTSLHLLRNYVPSFDQAFLDSSNNWFTLQNFRRRRELFKRLDTNRNGTLSQSELLGYSTGITKEFVQQLFQNIPLSRNREMTYSSFLDFVLAMENKKNPQALSYFFRVLDLNKVGFLSSFNLNVFYKGVYNKLEIRRYETQGNDPTPWFDDVRDELFDMVKPKDPLHITMQDLLNCGMCDVFVGVLIDADVFTVYDQRFCS
ncbi:serine/threonine-protein phosphatase 2A regulatory subunit B'' subunit gamma [Pelomyxa schiedti]|nr:serine/threonine-protein phosphatase 2A regulatory subunit B'' subunit gamma [Pelomyxa schiedti]